jgi:hypothetical protein
MFVKNIQWHIKVYKVSATYSRFGERDRGRVKLQNKKFQIVLREVLGLHKIKEITLLKGYSTPCPENNITLLYKTFQYPFLFSILFTINLIYLAESNRNKRKKNQRNCIYHILIAFSLILFHFSKKLQILFCQENNFLWFH